MTFEALDQQKDESIKLRHNDTCHIWAFVEMLVDFVLVVSIPRHLHHKLSDGIDISGEIHDQGEKIEARGIQKPALLVDVSYESNTSGPK